MLTFRNKTATGFRPSPHKQNYQEEGKVNSNQVLPAVKQKGMNKMVDTNLSPDEILMMDNNDDYIDDRHQPKM